MTHADGRGQEEARKYEERKKREASSAKSNGASRALSIFDLKETSGDINMNDIFMLDADNPHGIFRDAKNSDDPKHVYDDPETGDPIYINPEYDKMLTNSGRNTLLKNISDYLFEGPGKFQSVDGQAFAKQQTDASLRSVYNLAIQNSQQLGPTAEDYRPREAIGDKISEAIASNNPMMMKSAIIDNLRGKNKREGEMMIGYLFSGMSNGEFLAGGGDLQSMLGGFGTSAAMDEYLQDQHPELSDIWKQKAKLEALRGEEDSNAEEIAEAKAEYQESFAKIIAQQTGLSY